MRAERMSPVRHADARAITRTEPSARISLADLDGELLIRIEVGRSVVRVLSSPEDGG